MHELSEWIISRTYAQLYNNFLIAPAYMIARYLMITLRFVCLFVCFVALRPKSTAMVIAGRSVHLTTNFPGQA